MSEYSTELFSAYLSSGLEELLTYYDYVELININHLPVSADTDTYASANTGNSLTAGQRVPY